MAIDRYTTLAERHARMTSRRRFLQTLLGSGASAVVAGWPAGAAERRSSRRCRPRSAGSPGSTTTRCRPARFLPESLGPGCAFLDYDNDGWMDLYLVNSGPSDFYKPAQAAQERAVPQQSRRHVHRRHGQGGRGGRYVRHGRRRRRLRQRRLSRHVRHRLRPIDSLSQQRRRDVHRRHREGGPRAGSRMPAGRRAPCGSITTTTAGSTCSWAATSSIS